MTNHMDLVILIADLSKKFLDKSKKKAVANWLNSKKGYSIILTI